MDDEERLGKAPNPPSSMNGVRRFLGGAVQRPQSPPLARSSSEVEQCQAPMQYTIAPLSIASKSIWQPTVPTRTAETPNGRPDGTTSSTVNESKSFTNGIRLQRSVNGRQKSTDSDYRPQSISSPASSYRKSMPDTPDTSPTSVNRSYNSLSAPSSPPRPMPNRVTQLRAWKRASGSVDPRDELLMSLLASEAIVDSRDYDILHSEDVEELKKEREILETRLHAMQKKLRLETKIRDAAASLAKVNAAHKSVSKQSAEQLEAANRKVETAQAELWRNMERSNEINRKLLEHQAGVLSFSVRNLEAKLVADSDEAGYNAVFRNTQMSPTSSETSYSSSRTKFDGAHLFAGHENAVMPLSPRKPPGASAADVAFLEERLKDTTAKLQAATVAQNEAKRETSMLKVELQGLETSLALELQSAEEKVASMKAEVDKVASLELQLQELCTERENWHGERDEKERKIVQLNQRLKAMEEKFGDDAGTEQRVTELQTALDALESVMESRGLRRPAGAPPVRHVAYLETYLSDVQSRMDAHQKQKDEWEALRYKLEEDVRAGLDKREVLSREVEDARREREEYRERVRSLEAQLKATANGVPVKRIDYEAAPVDVKHFVQILMPLWNALPSLELRASKFGLRVRSARSAPGSPNPSLSELDVRLLKTMYDGRPSYQTTDASAQFTIEALAARVQALIADDRALIERLVRFAQAHELLKQNADRAQKIAQDSSVALETYQKQVKALEDRNLSLQSSVNTLQNEIVELQEAVDKLMKEKRELESQAAEQAETCRQLTEANTTLSARALSLAEEVSSAPEAIRNQLEKQLSECRSELQKAQGEIHAMQTAEASQNIALMDELNQMQAENDTLRTQLRAAQAVAKR